jgi:tetratricopeptide (TPR) repeat protein
VRTILISLFVVLVAWSGGVPVEAQPGRGGKMRSPRPGAHPDAVRFSRAEVTEVKRSYRGVLKTFASGDREAALEGLASLESRYVNPRQMQGTGRLGKVQSEVIRDLAQREPELVLPILLLHLDATREYSRRQEWYLASHARRLAGALAETYAQDGGSQGSRVMAARALTTLGAALQEEMTSEHCRCVPFYERALDFVPDDEAALMGLATVFEKAADYERAVRELHKLLESHPQVSEARLRLAINLKRLGREREALEQLDTLTTEAADTPPGEDGAMPDWVLSLAFQEQARSAIDRGDWQGAEAILLAARQQLPDQQRLIVLHAFVLEQTRRMRQARRVLQALRGQGAATENTPRLLYTRMPKTAVEDTEARLREGAESRFSLLKDALEKSNGGTR